MTKIELSQIDVELKPLTRSLQDVLFAIIMRVEKFENDRPLEETFLKDDKGDVIVDKEGNPVTKPRTYNEIVENNARMMEIAPKLREMLILDVYTKDGQKVRDKREVLEDIKILTRADSIVLANELYVYALNGDLKKKLD